MCCLQYRSQEMHDLQATAVVLRVCFASDRELSGDRHPARMFGSGRGQLRYGSCEVSVPRDHRLGELESPSLLRLLRSWAPSWGGMLTGDGMLTKD